jgi:hypothetical protein
MAEVGLVKLEGKQAQGQTALSGCASLQLLGSDWISQS